ncbi:MAG: diaminohydroxyphosphoribosylaminopyrimidine deaminase [Saprospiraceae bacterium]|jgi:diaminohydroxyphosphoribosylaminopyrimidine deaminase/5-amino-6-(5-phosphoribosylamino)uracil reductase
MKQNDILYMKRCFDLAVLGRGSVSPNPMVGAVIVHNDRIIGEGFHMKYGSAHAEVNAVNSVLAIDKHLLPESTIYINLEPCCIHGNTPPCTDLIIKHKIPRVVFSCVDQTSGVRGKSIKILEGAGCKVTTGIEKNTGKTLIRERTVFATLPRPYIILKYAQSADGFIGKNNKSIWLTNPVSKRLVHKWRSEVDAIIVGTKTAAIDNPHLTNRLFFGKSPLRIVLDRKLELARHLNLFDQNQLTWVVTQKTAPSDELNLLYKSIPFNDFLLPEILRLLHLQKNSSLIVEGGKKLLDSFIHLGLWDEARVFESPSLLYEGLRAPILQQKPQREFKIEQDKLMVFYK